MDYFVSILKGLAFPMTVLGLGTAYAFWNPNLMKAAWRTGNHVGMGYNYFKVILKALTPESEQSAKIIAEFWKGS